MPICKLCGNNFPNRLKIDGKYHVLSSRKYCFNCSPFKQHNTKQLLSQSDQNAKEIERKKKSVAAITRVRRALATKAVEYKGGQCQICGYNKCESALEFHHIDPTTKLFGIKSGNIRSWAKLQPEIDKCVLLCSNCHREVEAGITQLPS